MTIEDFTAILQSPAAVALLVLVILWAGAKGLWVYGKTHQEAVEREQKRAEEWKEIATGIITVADKAVSELETKDRR